MSHEQPSEAACSASNNPDSAHEAPVPEAAIEASFAGQLESPESTARSSSMAPAGNEVVAAEVGPSACGCGGSATATKVFAIGQLSYDFASVTVKQSVQHRMTHGKVDDPASFMKHLFRMNHDDSGKTGKLNLHEASRVQWVLEYGGVPQYVVEPLGVADVTALTDLIFDYMEQEGFADEDQQLRLGTKNGLLDPDERPDHFAIPGFTNGKMAMLANTRRAVPILYPEYDLTDSWNLNAVIKKADTDKIIDKNDDNRVAEFRRMASALYSYIDPKGDTPEGRALNFIASASVLFAARTELLQGHQIALKGFSQPVRIEARYEEQIVYEIIAHYFDVTNVHNANYHRKYHIEVSEAKPRLVNVTELGFGPGSLQQ